MSIFSASTVRERSVSSLGLTDAEQYPYGMYSAQTKLRQDTINVFLIKHGLCPIIADGKLGPATCGAALSPVLIQDPDFLASGAFAPTTCRDAVSPRLASAPGGCGTGPMPPPADPSTPSISAATASTLSSSSGSKVALCVGAAALLTVAYLAIRKN